MKRGKTRAAPKMRRDPILGTLASTRRAPLYAVSLLKTQRSYKQARGIIEQARALRMDDALFGMRKAKTWDDILKRPRLDFSRTWLDEVGWLAHGFIASHQQINTFLAQRKAFGKYYLLGEFDAAERLLDEIADDHGFSFWLAERQLMLQQARSGFDRHKQHLEELQKKISDGLIGYIISLLSDRLEPHVRYDSFNSATLETLTALREDGYEFLASLVEVQASPWTNRWTEHLHQILAWCADRPMVDRYALTIKALSRAPVGTLDDSGKVLLAEILTDIRGSVKDQQLTHLLWAHGLPDVYEHTGQSEPYIAAYDALVTGKLEECAARTLALLKDDPTSFDLYWLLARARACSSAKSETGLDQASIAATLLAITETIAENRVDLSVAFSAAKSWALKLGDNHLGISLWQFAERETTKLIDVDALRYASIAGKVHSLETFVEFNQHYRRECVEHLEQAYGDRPSVRLYSYLHGSIAARDDLIADVVPAFKNIAQAERAARSEHFGEVLEHLALFENVSAAHIDIRWFTAMEAARLECEALIKLNRPIDAAQRVLFHYVSSRNLLRHVPVARIIEGVRAGVWPEVVGTPYWPVLTFLNEGDAQDVYECVDDFLAANKLDGPRELILNQSEYARDVRRILYRDVLVSEVISRGALWANSPESQRTLRTDILKALYELSVEDQAFVVSELSEIEQARLLDAAYRSVEGPKFYLDFAAVNAINLQFFESSFDRYCAYRAYEEKGGHVAVESDLLELAKAGEAARAPEERRMERSEVLLDNIATLVFIEHLWNTEKGVNSILTTRIRHGSLENQFKRVFGAHGLSATKDLQGNYQCDRRVRQHLTDAKSDQRTDIEEAYVRFTERINEIYTQLTTECLRIKVPPEVVHLVEQQGLPAKELTAEDGLLDYSSLFQAEALERLKALGATSLSSLLAELQKMFVEQTRLAFDAVRQWLAKATAEAVTSAIDDLDAVLLSKMENTPQRAALRNELLAAKDGFPNDLRVIENWFSLAESLNPGTGSVASLISMAARVVGFASNGRLGEVKQTKLTDEPLSPEHGVALYEVLSILLRNIVQHSKVSEGQLVHYAYSATKTGRLLTVRNLMPTTADAEHAVSSAQERLLAPSDPRVLDRSPGGTGLARIKALLSPFATEEVDVAVDSDGDAFIVTVSF